MKLMEKFEAKLRRAEAPEFRPGDTIKVHVRVVEGDKERSQVFQGVVMVGTTPIYAREPRRHTDIV